jgi:hypothetical protein
MQQASLAIQGLQANLQYNAQKKAIEDGVKLQNAPLEAKIKLINAGQEKMSNNAALAGESLGKLNDKIATQKQKIDDVNTAMTTLRINAAAAGKTLEDYVKYGTNENPNAGKQDAAAFVGSSKTAGVKVPASSGGQYVGSTFVANKPDVGKQALDMVTTTNDAVAKGLAAKGIQMGSGDIYIVGKDGSKTKADVSSATGSQAFTGKTTTYTTGQGAKAVTTTTVNARDLYAQNISTQAGSTFKIGKQAYEIVGVDNAYAGTLKVKKAGYGTMKLDPRIPTIVGDRGPEMAFGGMVIPNMAKLPFASPRYDVGQAAKMFEPMHDSSGSKGVINYTQNIYASPGMNEDQLISKAKVAAYEFLQDNIKINAKMKGNPMNVSIKT